jgi:hypothetical protein
VPVARERRRDLFGHLSASPVVDSDMIANRRERARDRGADPARRAGNKHRPIVAAHAS